MRLKSRQTRYGRRHVPGEMNQTETLYAELLEARRIAGEILMWYFEAVTFKVAKDSRYTPDFLVQLADGSIEFVDTKAAYRIDPDSMTKIKVCADKFPQFLFAIEKRRAKKNGGGFERREF